MKVGILQGAPCKRAKMRGRSRSVNLWTGSQGHPTWKATTILCSCLLPWPGGAKFCHAWFELALSRRSLAGPLTLQAASAWSCCLNLEHTYKSHGEVNSQPATSLSTEWGKTSVKSLEALQANLSWCQDVKDACLYWPEGYLCPGVVCGNEEHRSESWAVVLCTVSGTLVQQLLLLCLKVCHSSPVILSDPRDPFNFVFIKRAALHFWSF